MSVAQPPVSDMLVTVKAREVQRGMLAEMRGAGPTASRHFLAAAHLELVLVDDYRQAGYHDLAIRSRASAASCFWRAGHPEQARALLASMIQDHPAQAAALEQVLADLEQASPGPAP
jgi:hypothetical protein